MADDCTFCEIKSFNGMYKGMEICFTDSDIIKSRIQPKSRKYVNAASFILLILCGYLFFSFYQENYAAYAYVGVDINPSIEISLNKKEKIIGVRGIDEEGKKIASELSINKMESTEGIKEIIKKAIDENYLNPDSTNKITVYTIMEKSDDNMGDIIVNKMENAIADEVSSHSIKGEIKTFVSDKNVKKLADSKGISVVQYLSSDLKSVMTDKESIKQNKKEDDKDKKEKNSSMKDNKNNNKDKNSKNNKEYNNNNKENNKDNNKEDNKIKGKSKEKDKDDKIDKKSKNDKEDKKDKNYKKDKNDKDGHNNMRKEDKSKTQNKDNVKKDNKNNKTKNKN